MSEYRNGKIRERCMIFCSEAKTNYEQFYCQVACENKQIGMYVLSEKPLNQLDLSGQPIATTPLDTRKTSSKSIKESRQISYRWSRNVKCRICQEFRVGTPIPRNVVTGREISRHYKEPDRITPEQKHT